MNSTIAVALITSVSTLAGAGISGYITFLVTRVQSNNQLLLAKADRLDQQIAAKRQIRRDAYMQYLTQLGKVEQIFDAVWQSVPPAETVNLVDLIAPIKVELSALQQTINILILEGSDHASNIAMKLQAKLTLESVDIVEAAKKSNSVALCIQDDKKYIRLMMERASIKRKMISAAQGDLRDTEQLQADRSVSTQP